MTSKDKQFKEIIESKKTEYPFGLIDKFLKHFGFTSTSKRSSHFIYRKDDAPHITLVVHKKKVKRWYVKRSIQILKDYKLL